MMKIVPGLADQLKMKIRICSLGMSLFLLSSHPAWSQSLPLGTPVLENYYRNAQLLGKVDSSISFTIRPLFTTASLQPGQLFDPDSTLQDLSFLAYRGLHQSDNKQFIFQLLPISWQQQYNSKSPYGWNDGVMIPARGYQTMLSAGFFAKIGPFSVQLRPESVYAANRHYDLLDIYGGAPDLPAQFGKDPYSKTSWGQSSIRLTVGPMSLGLSNENLWWGPGMRNSMLMTNNASGFNHLTLNTIKPIHSPIGSFEFQMIGAKLESSGFSYLDEISDNSGWRYLSALAFNYQPKWVPGLFLGLTRNFLTYKNQVKDFGDYMPLFRPFQKVKDKNNVTGADGKDQLASFYARWLFKHAHAEVYVEYGVNDHAYNLRDFIGSPEHARAYLFGLSKITKLNRRNGEYIKANLEITQMSQSIDRMVRDAGSWYVASHGYTQKGQIIGAGIGPGGNLQTLSLSWLKGLKTLGFQIERYVHNDDYYKASTGDLNGFSRKWVDMSVALQGTWNYKNLLLNANMQFINSLNYQWKLKNYQPGSYYIPENDVFNFHGELGLTYRF